MSDLEGIRADISRAFYGTNPEDYADGISDLIPLITIEGAVFCEGSNMPGHWKPGFVMCPCCGAGTSAVFGGNLLPHWRPTLAAILKAAGA